jgi:hypothetical protein
MKSVLKRLGLVVASPVLFAGVAVGCIVVSVTQILHLILVSPAVYVATGKTLIVPEDIVDFWLKSNRVSAEPMRAQRGEDPTTATGPSL